MNGQRARALLLSAALAVGLACSAILDFEQEVECWCGERWIAQISGATATNFIGISTPIVASDTTHEACVSQLEHIALDAADPQDPVYLAIRGELENGAIANCEVVAKLLVGNSLVSTTCAMSGQGTVTTNITHVGACWDTQTLAPDAPDPCGLESQCGAYYDCTDEAIVNAGDDEGGEGLLWACGPQ